VGLIVLGMWTEAWESTALESIGAQGGRELLWVSAEELGTLCCGCGAKLKGIRNSDRDAISGPFRVASSAAITRGKA
jgi:hypothetical protein